MSEKDMVAEFAAVPLLSTLGEADVARLAQGCRRLSFSSGQTVFDRENPNTDVMIVLEGRVHVTGYSITGKEVSFAEIEAGDFFGEVAAVDGEPRSAAVVAITDCRLAALSAELFRKLMRENHDIAFAVMTRMSAIIRRATERLMDFSTLSARQRITSEVLRMAEPSQAADGAWEIHPLPTQETIGARVGTSRETVARTMAELAKGGLIVKKGRTVTIPDRRRLEILLTRLSENG